MGESDFGGQGFWVSLLMFPRYFQQDVLGFVWGSFDSEEVRILKRLLLLWPALAVLFALWASIPNLLSLVVRARRTEFIVAYLLTWWDLGKCVASFWGGFLKLGALVVGTAFNLVRVFLAGIWLLVQDLLLAPFRAVRYVGRNVAAPGLPWIATTLTVFWCLLEAVIFSYVMTPLVMDTLSNLTGGQLPEFAVRLPLFLFLFFLILGSYAVLSAWAEAIQGRKVGEIIRISAVELVAAMVEVIFLYREFVDALVPWFSAHAGDGFDPGAGTIIGVALGAWVGVRGMTWFLFASHGTPILMALIRGQGLGSKAEVDPQGVPDYLAHSRTLYNQIRWDTEWLRTQAESLLAAAVLPPLQILGAALNHVIILVTGRVVFELPFQALSDVMGVHPALRSPGGRDRGGPKAPASPAPVEEPGTLL